VSALSASKLLLQRNIPAKLPTPLGNACRALAYQVMELLEISCAAPLEEEEDSELPSPRRPRPKRPARRTKDSNRPARSGTEAPDKLDPAAVALEQGDRLRPAGDAQLAQDLRDVDLHRAFGQAEQFSAMSRFDLPSRIISATRICPSVRP
jgi:hypothetical protein